jgi:hypothetical protein
MNMKTVWYVAGDPEADGALFPTFFDSKEAAEFYARLCFPDENPDSRIARIYYRLLWTLKDLQEEQAK